MDGLLEHIRRSCMRHDTVVAHAFRRTLGVNDPSAYTVAPRADGIPRAYASGVYDGMGECFANRKRVRL